MASVPRRRRSRLPRPTSLSSTGRAQGSAGRSTAWPRSPSRAPTSEAAASDETRRLVVRCRSRLMRRHAVPDRRPVTRPTVAEPGAPSPTGRSASRRTWRAPRRGAPRDAGPRATGAVRRGRARPRPTTCPTPSPRRRAEAALADIRRTFGEAIVASHAADDDLADEVDRTPAARMPPGGQTAGPYRGRHGRPLRPAEPAFSPAG